MSRSIGIGSVGREAFASDKLKRALAAAGVRGLTLALAALVIISFGLRLSGIERVGFAEDEINKLDAVRSYERGDISPNAEHPMLMKALMYASMQVAHVWNARAETGISDEAALRFPNILFGALTVLPIFLLTAALFDRRTGLIAAALWSTGLNAITYNRIAKEDTLLVFFMLFAFYFYLRAKQTSGFDAKGKRRYYSLSGISFGLMMASKYFPHYFGLNMLYHHLYRVREREPAEPRGTTPRLFYILVAAAFLIANPAVLLPHTWAYLNAYTSEQLLTHTGYLMGEHLYRNNVSSTPFGTPFYFYALFLAIKTPLPLLFAFLVGLFSCLRKYKNPGHGFLLLMFALWIIPYSLMGAKWLRYTLSLMPFVYMIAAVGIVSLIGWMSVLVKKVFAGERAMQMATAVALVVFILLPAWTAYAAAPHYALYTNALGGGARGSGYYFPHDEFYDDGLREAIRHVCETAPQGATVLHETPGVARYYLEKCGRTDLNSRVLSAPDLNLNEVQKPAYVIYQRGRTYFENQEKLKEVREKWQLEYEVSVQGLSAVEVYILLK